MKFFPDAQTILEFGVFSIRWYAVTMILGVLLTAFFAYFELKKNGYGLDLVEDLLMGCFISGVIGARLWYCAFYNLPFYLENPIEILKIYEGGLAIQGGLFAGAIYAYIYCAKRKINFMRAADCVVPAMLIAQAVGRWGNFINKEAYGRVVSESYFKYLPEFIKHGMYIGGQFYEPTFLYESIGNFIGFILIWFIYRKSTNRKRGDLSFAYLMWYGIVRLIVEGFRSDSLMAGNFRMAQVVSVLFIIVGAMGIFGVFTKLFKNPKPVILFDLDGTLLDTEPAIIETYRRLFEKYQTVEEFTRDKQLSVLGPSLKTMFPKYFPGHDVNKLIEEYRVINMDIHAEFVKPMKHAVYLLNSLKMQGYKLGIVSTKKKDVILYGLDLYDMQHYFDVIIGEDNVKRGKPSPEGILTACRLMDVSHDSCIYVGDSPMDIQAAKNAGVFSIGYIFNQERIQILLDEKPNRVIKDLIEIEEIIKEDHLWTYNMM